MKKLALIGVALATLMSSAAMAQSVDIGVGPGGAGVYVHDGYRDGWREREYRRSRAEYRDDRRWRRHEWERRHHHHGDRVYIERY